ncbi:hypothetical protein GF340_04660 [Candidatus Peregrinibacteria bacterium]|nr:hypothetical protein [Candidatus Peregrinibacteria bacterium]
MKAFFLAGSVVFSALILVLAALNIQSNCSNFLYLGLPIKNPFLIVIMTAAMGVFAGLFFAGLLVTLTKKSPEDAEDAPNTW